MSTLFSHFFQKFNQISPLEANFTEVLDAIALKPKTLYFHGKMPENMSKMENLLIMQLIIYLIMNMKQHLMVHHIYLVMDEDEIVSLNLLNLNNYKQLNL